MPTLSAAWIRVNGEHRLDNGAGLASAYNPSSVPCVVRTSRGDVIYGLNYGTTATAAGRVRWSNHGEWQWEVWTGDEWSTQTDAVPASATDTFGGYSAGLALFADPTRDEGVIGVGVLGFLGIRSSTLGLDIHAMPVSLRYNDDNGWVHWYADGSEQSWQRHHARSLVQSRWYGQDTDFAFDKVGTGGNERVGIAVSCRKHDNMGTKLAAARMVYDVQTGSCTWSRWRWVQESGQWHSQWYSGMTSWPSETAVVEYHIMDRGASLTSEWFEDPKVVYIGSGRYLVTFEYSNDGGSTWMTTAGLYDDTECKWCFWSASQGGWREVIAEADPGYYDYEEIVAGRTSGQALVRNAPARASLFYHDPPPFHEVTYDETGVTPVWTEGMTLASAYRGYATEAGDGTIWLYYTVGVLGSERIELLTKPAGGSWAGSPEVLYSRVNGTPTVMGASFLGASEIPICLFVELAVPGGGFQDYSIYAIAEQSYGSAESPLVLEGPGDIKAMDDRVSLSGQQTNTAPGAIYAPQKPGYMARDADGYLYCPDTAHCQVLVRHENLGAEDAHCWGRFWDHLPFPGGCAVDNIRKKVYAGNWIVGYDSTPGFVGHRSIILAWDIDPSINDPDDPYRYVREQDVGYKTSDAPASFDRAYCPQAFAYGSFPTDEGVKWPADVAVNEAQGLLFVTSAVECKVKVFDVDTDRLVDYRGSMHKFPKAYLTQEYSITDDEEDAIAIVDRLTSDTAAGTFLSLRRYTDPPYSYVYWDTYAEDIDSILDYIRGLSEWQGAFDNPNERDIFLMLISRWYKRHHEVPVYKGAIGAEGSGPEMLNWPQGIDVDGDGNIYVADSANHRIQKWKVTKALGQDPTWEHVKSWGRMGYDEGELLYPAGVAVDPVYNLVYVTDPFNHRVQIFSRGGVFLYSWGKWESSEQDKEFSHTYGVVADGQGNVYVGVEKTVAKFTIQSIGVDQNGNGVPDSFDLAPAFRVSDDADKDVAWFDVAGNLFLDGVLTQGNGTPPVEPQGDAFVFENAGGVVLAVIDATTGDMGIKGALQTQWIEPASAPGPKFLVDDASDETVAYIDGDGNLYLKGQVDDTW